MRYKTFKEKTEVFKVIYEILLICPYYSTCKRSVLKMSLDTVLEALCCPEIRREDVLFVNQIEIRQDLQITRNCSSIEFIGIARSCSISRQRPDRTNGADVSGKRKHQPSKFILVYIYIKYIKFHIEKSFQISFRYD